MGVEGQNTTMELWIDKLMDTMGYHRFRKRWKSGSHQLDGLAGSIEAFPRVPAKMVPTICRLYKDCRFASLRVLFHRLGTSLEASETMHGACQLEFIRKHTWSEKIHRWVELAGESESPEMEPTQVAYFKPPSPGPCFMLRHISTLSVCLCLGLDGAAFPALRALIHANIDMTAIPILYL